MVVATSLQSSHTPNTLQAQLPTRRFFNTLLDNCHFVVCMYVICTPHCVVYVMSFVHLTVWCMLCHLYTLLCGVCYVICTPHCAVHVMSFFTQLCGACSCLYICFCNSLGEM